MAVRSDMVDGLVEMRSVNSGEKESYQLSRLWTRFTGRQ